MEYMYVDTENKVAEALKMLEIIKVVGIGTETTGPIPLQDKLRLLQIAAEGLPVILIDWFKVSSNAKKNIKNYLESDVIKVLHNAKVDFKFLYVQRIDISVNLYDTMLAAQVIDSGCGKLKFKLQDLVENFTEFTMNKEKQTSDWSLEVLSDEQLQYAAVDASVLIPLRKALNKELKESNLEYVASIEFSAVPAVAQMELNGIAVDIAMMKQIQEKYRQEMQCLENIIAGYFLSCSVNLNSPAQVKKALATIGIDVEKTSKEELIPISMRYPVVKYFLEYKKLEKLIQFTEKIISEVKSGRLYSQYLQCNTKTGRFTCSNFNLQQVPHDTAIRECFTASMGKALVIADYSQIELRIASEIAKDYTIINSYRNNQDLHSLTASLVNSVPIEEVSKNQRQSAKALNFGLLYGMGSIKFKQYAMNNYGVDMSHEEAEKFRNRFFKYYHGIKKWHSLTSTNIRNTSEYAYFETRTLSNRRRLWYGKSSFTETLNSPVQGTGADILKIALGHLTVALAGTSAKILATVHDEIILEVESSEAESVREILKNVMEHAGSELLKEVPTIAEAKVAMNWGEK